MLSMLVFTHDQVAGSPRLNIVAIHAGRTVEVIPGSVFLGTLTFEPPVRVRRPAMVNDNMTGRKSSMARAILRRSFIELEAGDNER